jgi:hypothetical protein
LEAFRNTADVDTLRFVTGEDGNSLNLSLATNFQELDDAGIDAAIKALGGLAESSDALSKEMNKLASDTNIASLLLLDYEENYKNSVDGTNLEAAKAFGI